jgi:hypothetical protein
MKQNRKVECRNCRFWTQETILSGECQVAPTPVRTTISYWCREFAAASTACGSEPGQGPFVPDDMPYGRS